jgi:hypothetical protein
MAAPLPAETIAIIKVREALGYIGTCHGLQRRGVSWASL